MTLIRNNMKKILSTVVLVLAMLSCEYTKNQDGSVQEQETILSDEFQNYGQSISDSLKEIILKREISNNSLTINIPRSWQIIKQNEDIIAAEFNYLNDTGYFRIAKFKNPKHASSIHFDLLADLSQNAIIQGDTNCLDSLVSNGEKWLLNSQVGINFGKYERYLTVMYVKKSDILWQYFILLPKDGTKNKMGKYILGQILFNSKYRGVELFNSNRKIDDHHIICR